MSSSNNFPTDFSDTDGEQKENELLQWAIENKDKESMEELLEMRKFVEQVQEGDAFQSVLESAHSKRIAN